MFDPDGVLFRGSAHMPLFGFLDMPAWTEVETTRSGWGALAKGKGRTDEGKGHADDENKAWTTYSQSTNEGNRWGAWQIPQPMGVLMPWPVAQATGSMATSSNGQPLWPGGQI